MHAFQKVDIDQFEVNPFDKIGKDWMLVTAGNEEKANTMTASWGGMGVMSVSYTHLDVYKRQILRNSFVLWNTKRFYVFR